MQQEYYNELYNLLVKKQHDNSVTWDDIKQLKAKYGINESSDFIRQGSKSFYEFLNAGWVAPPKGDIDIIPLKETITLNADKTETSEINVAIDDESRLRDYEYLLKLHNYDPDLFEVKQAKNSKWQCGDRVLYSSKLTVKPKSEYEIKFNTDNINSILADINPWQTAEVLPKISNGNMLLISISDLHMNLKSSEMITGNEYNCGVAEECFNRAMHDIFSETKNYNFSKIVFTIGGDMFNADNVNNTTVHGTQQDCEVHMFEAFERMLRIVTSTLIKLEKFAPVDVIYIPGNHDETVGWHFAKVLEAYFREDENITIDTSPLMRKYYVYGNTLLVFAHDADVKRLPMIIADEARDLWSKTKYTDVYLQHLHSEQVLLEDHHIRIQRLPTISGVSKWTHEKGYSSARQNKAFIYDYDRGLKTVIYSHID